MNPRPRLSVQLQHDGQLLVEHYLNGARHGRIVAPGLEFAAYVHETLTTIDRVESDLAATKAERDRIRLWKDIAYAHGDKLATRCFGQGPARLIHHADPIDADSVRLVNGRKSASKGIAVTNLADLI
jgi:hypothetical protein